MSTVRANNYYDASGGSNAQLYGVASPPNSMGFRNRLINGQFWFDQRNNGASVTPTADGSYTLDRWKVGLTQASKFSVQRSSVAPAGFTTSLLVTSTSAYSVGSGDTFLFQQNIEGNNVADLGWGAAGAQTVTLSFWVRSSLTGTFGGSVINSAANRNYLFSYSISAANTWEYKTVTVPGDTTGTWLTDTSTGIVVRFGLGSGSTFSGTANTWQAGNIVQPTGTVSVVGTNGATFYITGVQLEAGTVASAFERRDYGRELIMCQRYYQVGRGDARGALNSNGQVGSQLMFPVVMRATPTIVIAGTAGTPNQAFQRSDSFLFYGTSIENSGTWTASIEL